MHWWHVLQHWLAVHTGTVNEPGPYYGFWSGFGSTLQQDVFFLAPFALLWHHLNCDVAGCKRPGPHHYDKDGHRVKVCKKHHPALGNGHKLSHQDLLDHHEASRLD